MPFVQVGLFLLEAGAEERGERLVDDVLARARRAGGYRSGFRVQSRVGHGDRWQGWITSWEDRDSLQAAADAAAESTQALRAISEPRTCQEVVLEVEPFGDDARPTSGGTAAD